MRTLQQLYRQMLRINAFRSRRSAKLLFRVAVLFIFSLIFKSFDLTFISSINGTIRAYAFSIVYIVFGLFAWEGGIYLSRQTEKSTTRLTPTWRLLAVCAILLLYGLLVAIGFGLAYSASDIYFFKRYEAWDSFRSLSYNMIFGTFLFYLLLLAFNGIILYYREWKEYQLRTERLQRENIQARYDALRNQIEPHFFFNALSVLTNLVYKNPDLSAEYITQLAKLYRYILDKKFENLVLLGTELTFLDSYLFLIQIRHQNSIEFRNTIPQHLYNRAMIPPATLQLLIENAIKHNRFSVGEPLQIVLAYENDHLIITNTKRKKHFPEPSNGIGLDNIRKRYELIADRKIEVRETDTAFQVKIPYILRHENRDF